MTISLDGAQERTSGPTHGIVECSSAIWTYRYWNGWTITLRGRLTAHILVIPKVSGVNQTYAPGSYSLKFDALQFDAMTYERLLSAETFRVPPSPTSQNTPLADEEYQPGSNEPQKVQLENEERWLCKEVFLPLSPINAFGIPQATMRCLEVSLPRVDCMRVAEMVFGRSLSWRRV